MATDIEVFFQEGFLHVPSVFTGDEVAALRAKTDACYAHRAQLDPKFVSYVHGAFVLRRGAEYDPLFASLVVHARIQELVSAVLGPQPAFNALNVIRNEPGQAISVWHVDDVLELPLPDDIPRFDARIRLPVLWLTVQVALSDIDTEAHGPTQFVPGSHYSGRRPPKDDEAPTFEGRGPVPVLCKAGDIYLTNHQCWHRGAPNLSDRTRYVLQLQYATRWADRRFRGVA